MRTRLALSLGFASFLVVIIILGLPIFFDGGVLEAFCTLPKANAQENQCLAIEATNSSLEVDLLKAQATNVSLQSTITVLEARLTGSEQWPQQDSIVPFALTEDFSTNRRGWDLRSDERGAARLSQGNLILTANIDKYKVVQIPGLEVGDEFYIQVQVTVDKSSAMVWLATINSETKFYHSFNTKRNGFHVVDNESVTIESRYSTLWDTNEPFTMALESRGGLYTFYINNVALETFQIVPYGNEIEIGVFGGTARFDNLVVRETR